jgi:hypothetical protein
MPVLWRMIGREQDDTDEPLTQVAASERLVTVLGLAGDGDGCTWRWWYC